MISKALVAGAYHTKLEALAQSGVELHVIIPLSWGDQHIEIMRGNGYEIYPLPIVWNRHNHFHFYRGLSHIINKVMPDIIHIDEEHYSLVTFQAMRLAKRSGAKALFFTWQNIFKKYPFPFSYIERYNFSTAHMAIAGNEEAKEILRRKGFKKDVAIIPQFGVDPVIFQKMNSSGMRDSLSIRKDSFVVGFMGRLVEEKGILDIIEAVSRLPYDIILLIVGSGPLKKDILDKAEELEVGKKIRLMEHVSSLEVPLCLSCFDCLVLPSRTRPNWKEQFGRILIEAMACEVPVIGSTSGEIPHVIGDAGLLFKEGDINELAKKIELLLNDVKERYSQGARGRQRVLDHYTQRMIAQDTFDVYKKIMRG